MRVDSLHSLAAMCLVLGVGCLAPGGSADEGGAGGKADGESFNPYAATRKQCGDLGDRDCLRRLSPLEPNNVNIGNGSVRDQGKVASCASHGFIGMIENQLWLQRGIEVDLAERYQLYGNFMSSGGIGSDPAVIRRFPMIAAQYGFMPEALYPYSVVNDNAASFDKDLAQGLGATNGPTLSDALAGTPADSKARSDIETEPMFLGALPAPGGRPITIPVAARLASDADVPEVEFDDADGHATLAACFATTAGNDLTLTPREFMTNCLDHQPQQYFACDGFAPAVTQNDGESDCDFFKRFSAAWADGMVQQDLPLLANVLDLLDFGQSSVVGVNAPMTNQIAAVWQAKGNLFGGGHAVVVVGYLTADELADPDQQQIGLLATMFDKLAEAMEPGYSTRITANMTASQLRDVRVASLLGQTVTAEDGILLFRNSWGASVQGHPIGVDGYQAMTFRYFLRSKTLFSSSRSVGVVDPAACAPLPAFARSDRFFTAFPAQSLALGKNAVMTMVVSQLAQSGATQDQINAAIQGMQSCQ